MLTESSKIPKNNARIKKRKYEIVLSTGARRASQVNKSSTCGEPNKNKEVDGQSFPRVEAVGRLLNDVGPDGESIPVILGDDLTNGTNVNRELSMNSPEIRKRASEGEVKKIKHNVLRNKMQ